MPARNARGSSIVHGSKARDVASRYRNKIWTENHRVLFEGRIVELNARADAMLIAMPPVGTPPEAVHLERALVVFRMRDTGSTWAEVLAALQAGYPYKR